MRTRIDAGRRVGFLALWALAGGISLAAQGPPVLRSGAPGEKIVNGFPIAGEPAVGLFDTGTGSCTATLIGCSTALTAAHCVCTDPVTHQILTGAQCAQRPDLLDPSNKFVFFHQAGLFHLASVAVHPAFVFGQTSDLAVLKLSSPVTGIAPTPLNATQKPGLQTQGTIVGFGLTEDGSSGAGIKRIGSLRLSTCAAAGLNGANHLCATLAAPLGPPGSNSGTCHGDSGGPLFVNFGAGPVLAGVTSGGDSPTQNCLPLNHLWFADEFKDRAWIEGAAGLDLGTSACGGVPAAGGPGTSLSGGLDVLSSARPSGTFAIGGAAVPTRLRVAVSGESYRSNDYVLYVKRDSAPTPSSFDCKGDGPGALAFCDLSAPTSTEWRMRVDLVSGFGGPYEIVTELITQPAPAPCVPSATTLCIDDQPGDRRFAVTATFETGAASGQGGAIGLGSLGVNQGGLFWFFSQANPELLVKVLNGCGLNDRFWVFLSGGTNVGVTVKIVDTVTGNSYMKVNPIGTPFPTIQDTTVGLPCS